MKALNEANEMCLVNVPTVIAACCVLHNVCEVHGESLNERWIEDSSDDNRELPQPPMHSTHRYMLRNEWCEGMCKCFLVRECLRELAA